MQDVTYDDCLKAIFERVVEFTNEKVPSDWSTWSLSRRKDFWNGKIKLSETLVERDRICAVEVWTEGLRQEAKISMSWAKQINEFLERINGWEKCSSLVRCGPYGVQRGFMRKTDAFLDAEQIYKSLLLEEP